MSTVPMIAPNGQSGDIPADKLDAARAAGFKVAVTMQSPDGQNGYVPVERSQEAIAKGFKMVPTNVPDASKPSYWDALTNPVGSGAHSQGLLGGIEQIGGQAIKTIAQPFIHPLDTAGAVLKQAGDLTNPQKFGEDLVQPIAENYAKDQAQGGNALALENLAGQAAGAIEQGRMIAPLAKSAVNSVFPDAANTAQAIRQKIRPTSSPSIVPRNEMASRQLAQAIIPANQDAPNFIKAAQEEVPNILDYAKRTGNPLNTQLEFSKAAQGYAQEVRGLYEDKVLGPNQNQLVKTTGTGFGRQMGEGPDTYGTLGDIDKRITNINQQLDKPTLNADDARRALATKQELQSEASGLRDILHKNLADATGLTPDEVADLRQRVGRSYELANDTDAAVTGRMQAAGKAELKPLALQQLPMQGINMLRGGPVTIADRAFQRAIRSFPGEVQPLPEINPSVGAPTPSNLDALITAIKQKRAPANQ